jgi:hypothetical protein
MAVRSVLTAHFRYRRLAYAGAVMAKRVHLRWSRRQLKAFVQFFNAEVVSNVGRRPI